MVGQVIKPNICLKTGNYMTDTKPASLPTDRSILPVTTTNTMPMARNDVITI